MCQLPQRDVRSLSLVSTTLYAALNEWALNILDVDPFLGGCPDHRAGEILRCTRQLTVKALIGTARGLTLGNPHEPTAHRGFLESLLSQMHQDLHPRQCLGCSRILRVPLEIDLSSLLITDGTCPHAGQHLEGLSCFTALSELEWEGIHHPSEALSIRFLSGENPQSRCGYADIVDLFPSSFRDDRTRPDLDGYSLLTSLTLSRALTLRDCPNELHFLQLLARSSRPVSLQYFEISSDYLRESGERLAFIAIAEFCLSFQGLQYLYLKISNFPQFLPGLDNTIRHHQSTLRGLIFHEQCRDDVTMTLPSIPRILQKICSPIVLGLCLRPRNLLVGLPIRSSIWILHLRFSGEERIYYSLRREIKSKAAGLDFCPTRKASELQEFIKLVYPDRSLDGACHGECYTANRTFCLADIDDDSLWDDLPLDGLDGPRFLSACPSTGLMESPYDL
ncbi:hypothetical protein BJX68DRAFT_278660 [Aspergillus pseudodeflectus]|uniref:F-box domain-containing protein n=1 Tax=Aspergillus pseudodeflectus TaxID=176178 RepID=A0ABR4JQC1_9EURO